MIYSYLKHDNNMKKHAMFISITTDENIIRIKGEDDDQENSLSTTEFLENSILKQIIYNSQGAKEYNSKLTKYKKIRPIYKFSLYIGTLLLLSPIIYFLTISTITNFNYAWILITLSSLSLGVIFYASIFFGIKLYENGFTLKYLSSNKVNIKFCDNKEMLFNSNIDEIIRIFEKRKIHYLIIEDIDRFNNEHILEKIKELNILINNALKKSNVKFIYLIKDNFFKGLNYKEKFFDIMIPVMPFVNINNSQDISIRTAKHLKILQDENNPSFNKQKLSAQFLCDTFRFVYDYRAIANIFNEFIIYNGHINSEDKIFSERQMALIVLKNIWTEVFLDLQNNKGIVVDMLKVKNNNIDVIDSFRNIEKFSKYNFKITFLEYSEKIEYLLFAIKKGYINQGYHLYVSNIINEIISVDSSEWLAAVLNGAPYDFEKKILSDIKEFEKRDMCFNALIEKLHPNDYLTDSILNYDFLYHIFKNKKSNQNLEWKILNYASEVPSFLINMFFKHEKLFFEIWENISIELLHSAILNLLINNVEKLPHQLCDNLIFIWLLRQDAKKIRPNEHISRYIEKNETILQNLIDLKKLKNFKFESILSIIILMGIKFDNLDIISKDLSSKSSIYYIIFKNESYNFCENNIKTILNFITEYSSEFKNLDKEIWYGSFLEISNSKNITIEEFVKNIKTNINTFIKLIVSTGKCKNETLENITHLLNDNKIDHENKISIIENLEEKIKIKDINNLDISLIEEIFNNEKLYPNINNADIISSNLNLDYEQELVIKYFNEKSIIDEILKDDLIHEEFVIKMLNLKIWNNKNMSLLSESKKYNNISMEKLKDCISHITEVDFFELNDENKEFLFKQSISTIIKYFNFHFDKIEILLSSDYFWDTLKFIITNNEEIVEEQQLINKNFVKSLVEYLNLLPPNELIKYIEEISYLLECYNECFEISLFNNENLKLILNSNDDENSKISICIHIINDKKITNQQKLSFIRLINENFKNIVNSKPAKLKNKKINNEIISFIQGVKKRLIINCDDEFIYINFDSKTKK
ncbi:MAG: hypothetical protein ACRC4M_04770 [Mycoplasma sp.]